MFILISFQGFSQQLKVRVSDKNGLSLPAATLIANDQQSLTTADGTAVFENITLPVKLKISYVGYEIVDTMLQSVVGEIGFVLYESKTMLPSSLVTASWAPDHSPVTQKTIRKEDFYSNAPVDMPALLENLPGTVSTSDAGNGIGYSAMRIRGSDQTRINVMIDGVPVNDAESQNVFWVDLPDLIEDVEMVQVQRGVGISTAGPGAFGANINLQTGQLPETQRISANAGYGSFNSQKYGLSFNTGTIGKYFRMKFRGSRISSDGYIDRASSSLWAGSFQSQYKKDNFSLAANFYWGKERTSQAWNGMPIQYYLADNKSTYNSAGLKGDGTFFDDETDNYRQLYSRMIGTYDFKYSTLKFTLYNTLGKGYYNQYREENINDYFEDVNPADVSLVRERWLDNNLMGINLLYGFRNSGWSYQAGGNVQHYNGKHYGLIKTVEEISDWNPRRYYENEANKLESSIFGKAEKRFNNLELLIDAQLRYIDYEYQGLNSNSEPGQLSKNYLFVNPKLGLSYFVGKSGNFYIYGGIANKEPNRDDFTDAAPGKLPKHERLINSELGYRFNSQRLQFSFNQYTMWYKDQLVLTGQINDAGAYTRFNVDESYRVGVEFDFKYNLTSWISLNSNLALSKNKIPGFIEYNDASALVEGEVEYLDQEINHLGTTDISFSPEAVYFFQVNYSPFVKNDQKINGLSFYYNFKYVSSQFLDNTSNEFAKLDAYNMHGIGLNFPFKLNRSHFVFDARVDNLLNKTFVNNGWIYRFKATGYDASEGDPTIQRERNDYYSSVGYFPQAGLRFFTSLKLMF